MYTSKVTEKGMITLPINLRRKFKIAKGNKVEIVETDDGILVIPIPPLLELYGSDPSMREVVATLSKSRRREIGHEAMEQIRS
jgi:AbrB family looped-hinge helix DNA binding protein